MHLRIRQYVFQVERTAVRTILPAQKICQSLRLDDVARADLRVVRLVGEPEREDTLFLV